TVFGAITVLGGLLGTAAGGALAEILRTRVRHAYLWVSGVSALAAAPLAILALRAHAPSVLWGATFAAEFPVFMSAGPVDAILVHCVAHSWRARGFAISIFVTHALGDVISPPIIGFVSDRTNLHVAVMLVPIAFALGAIAWLYAQRTLPVRAR